MIESPQGEVIAPCSKLTSCLLRKARGPRIAGPCFMPLSPDGGSYCFAEKFVFSESKGSPGSERNSEVPAIPDPLVCQSHSRGTIIYCSNDWRELTPDVRWDTIHHEKLSWKPGEISKGKAVIFDLWNHMTLLQLWRRSACRVKRGLSSLGRGSKYLRSCLSGDIRFSQLPGSGPTA